MLPKMLELSTIVDTLGTSFEWRKIIFVPDQCNELNQWTLADWDSAGVLNFRQWTRCPQYADLSPLPLQDYLTLFQIISQWSRLFDPIHTSTPIGYHSIGWINSLNQSRLFHPVQNISTQSKFLHSIHIILPHTYYFIHFLTQKKLLYPIQPSNFVLSFPKTSMFWVLSIKVPSQGKVRSGKDWIKTTFLNKSEYL